MNRRTLIKNLALVIGSATILPSCLKGNKSASVHLKNLPISGDQEILLSDICETIIPKTTTPGSKDLNLHLFVMMMVDDCYKKKDQQAFMVGMRQFDDDVQKKYNKSFSDLPVKDREDVLKALEAVMKPAKMPAKSIKPVGESGKSLPPPEKKEDIPPLHLFYGAVRQNTIFGYTNSKYFMTKQVVYELVPGRWNAHYPASKVNAA